MAASHSDRTWRHYGAVDPYYGVLTQEKFRSDNLTDDAKDEFFASGHEYVEQMFDRIRATVAPGFVPGRALDFGCGVGRLTLPLAQVSTSTVGVDISPAMLAEAASNASARSIDNVEFVEADDSLSRVCGPFDFIHSFIVFQHIPPERGERLVRRMLEMLQPGGVGALHFTYSNATHTPATRRVLTRSFERAPWLFGLRNLAKREPFGTPLMQMNRYNLNDLIRLLHESGCHRVSTQLTEASHFGYPVYGIVLYFAKVAEDVGRHS